MKKSITLILLFLSVPIINAQNTFQKLYSPVGGSAECFGSYQLQDGGYIFTGIVTNGTDKVFMSRTNCEGTVIWSKSYNNSSTVGNISQRAIHLAHGGFCLAASIGSFGSYNILIVKTDNNGNTIWQKIMQGSGDDVVNSVIETRSGDIVLAGHTSSFGQDAGSAYTDVYIAKIDSNGVYQWGRAIGTAANTDQAFDIYETHDSSLIATGRYIEQGTFYSFLLKMDESGMVNYLRAYGDTNQYSCGYGIIEAAGGGYAITGSTTIMKASYQSYCDEFIIKTNTNGDTVWSRTYHGNNPDGSENASSIMEVGNGFVVAVATMSYPTVGFVPNKHVVLKTDLSGNMNMVRSYNNGGSHYPYITKPADGVGILLSGFTTNYSSSTFKPIIIRTDNSYDSGCNQTDLLSQTVMEYPPFQFRTPNFVVASGGSLINSTISANLIWTDSVICAHIVDSCTISHLSIVENKNKANGKVYFNSSSDEIILEGFERDINSVEVYDYSGRLIISQNNLNPINVAKLNVTSVYFVVVKSAKETTSYKVFVGN